MDFQMMRRLSGQLNPSSRSSATLSGLRLCFFAHKPRAALRWPWAVFGYAFGVNE
jgi:hypothetical protein